MTKSESRRNLLEAYLGALDVLNATSYSRPGQRLPQLRQETRTMKTENLWRVQWHEDGFDDEVENGYVLSETFATATAAISLAHIVIDNVARIGTCLVEESVEDDQDLRDLERIARDQLDLKRCPGGRWVVAGNICCHCNLDTGDGICGSPKEES